EYVMVRAAVSDVTLLKEIGNRTRHHNSRPRPFLRGQTRWNGIQWSCSTNLHRYQKTGSPPYPGYIGAGAAPYLPIHFRRLQWIQRGLLPAFLSTIERAELYHLDSGKARYSNPSTVHHPSRNPDPVPRNR